MHQGPPDVVDTAAEARSLDPPPLVIREALRELMGVDELPDVERLDGGHSTPTFLVRFGASPWILRRPPRPPFAPSAHDVLHEHRFLADLRDHAVRVPSPGIACDDPSVIGAPFYLMQWIDGWVLRDSIPAPLDTPEQRARAGTELVDALVELHAVDPGEIGLGTRARGAGYLQRQLALWSAQWVHNQTRALPELDEVTRRLNRRVPESSPAGIVHGDYALDSVLFAPEAPARITAILDWEMATAGDPMADLGHLTATWVDPGEPPERAFGPPAITNRPGFPTRCDLASRYALRSGRGLEDLGWYQALALWKLAILLQASHRRLSARAEKDQRFLTLDERLPQIAEQALDASAGGLL